MSTGSNASFLNCFWELASDDTEKRLAAASQIISHVKGQGQEGNGHADIEYTLKRLVRKRVKDSIYTCVEIEVRMEFISLLR